MHAAFAQLFDDPAPEGISFSGRTDKAILREHIQRAAPGSEHLQAELQRLSCDYARSHARDFAAQGGVALPGAIEALALFARQQHLIQSVLTGNLRTIGEIKIEQIGAADYLDLDIAAYGDEHEVRAELVTAAVTAAQTKYNCQIPAEKVVLIGDTPLDVQAAKAVGARVLGVATGDFDAHELSAAGADAVFDSLTPAQQLLDALEA